MLTEEALLFLAGLGAFGMVILGTLELISPTRPRRARYRTPTAVAARRLREPQRRPAMGGDTASVGMWRAAPEPSARPAATPVAVPAAAAPTTAAAVKAAVPPAPPTAVPDGVRAGDVATPPPAGGEVPASPPADAEVTAPAGDPPIERILREQAVVDQVLVRPPAAAAVERCERLVQERQFAAAVRDASAALDLPEDALRLQDRLRLLDLVATAQQALGEPDAARVALMRALALSPREERAPWERRVAALALDVAPGMLERAGRVGNAVERVTAIRAALEWFDTGLAAAPDDARLGELADAARAALWPACREAVEHLQQRAEFEAARAILRAAMDDPGCPPQVKLAFRHLLAGTFAHEVGRLAAEGIERMHVGDGSGALAALDRAEAVLRRASRDVLAGRRRRELERRLWWAYTRLGARHADDARWDEALEPLLRALAFEGAGASRHDRTRALLTRTLAGIIEARGELVERLVDEGDREGARAVGEMLRAVLDTALERGLTREDLDEALARADRLLERARV